ncbi:MAG: PAS domain S-box protein [Bacteroidota bacterium]
MVAKKDSRLYNLLVIEDNQGDYILIEDFILESIALPNLVQATSLRQAKEIIESSPKFDLVMLDLTLPDGNGSKLITEVVKLCPETPVVVLTGYTDFEFSVQSLALGVADYLLKDELTASSLYKNIIYNIERKKMLSELEESQKRYNNLFDLSPDPTWVYDLESEKFLDVNEAAVREYGFTHEEFMAMTVSQLDAGPEIKSKPAPSPYSFHETDKTQQYEVSRHRRKNGALVLVENQTAEIFFQGKAALIMVARDVTERVSYVEAIEKQNQRLSEIAWIQSHVVRAPIARLMGLIDLIKQPGNDEELKLELLGHVLGSAHELDSIVREITQKAEEIDWNDSPNKFAKK